MGHQSYVLLCSKMASFPPSEGLSEITYKVSFFYQCSKMQFITFQNFHIQTWFSQFLWFFSLKCWFKGQMISRIHLILPNAYKLMCFDRNINGNRDVKFLECDKWSLHWYENLTLVNFFCEVFGWIFWVNFIGELFGRTFLAIFYGEIFWWTFMVNF